MINVLITGITGTLGTEVTKRLSQRPEIKISGITRDEHKLKKFRAKFPNVEIKIANIAHQLIDTGGIDFVFHFAASKHVDLMEDNPYESIQANLRMTDMVLESCKKSGSKMIFTSTDKAAYPINTYGLCKSLSEKLVLKYDMSAVCRYGNVLASNGSVIHLFKEKILAGEPVPITDPKMTRFWISIERASQFVIDVGLNEYGLNIPTMKAYNVENLARLIAKKLWKPIKIEYVGLRPGEKIHECLTTRYDKGTDFYSNDEYYTDNEMLELIEGIL